MEEVEAGLLEGGIGWLAETILENLDADKLDDWIRQVGLADDTKKLRSEIERVDGVVAAVKGRAIWNRSLARSLRRLRELLYDADDAIDEIDYHRLQHQVQRGDAWHGDPDESADGHGAEQTGRPRRGKVGEASGSGGKRRSGIWQHFESVENNAKARCVDCGTVVKCGSDNGTSVLHNHRKSGKCKRTRGATDQPPNPPSASEGGANSFAAGNSVGRKRMRTEGASADNVAASMHPWNKTELSNTIQQMTHQLQEAMNEVMKLRGSDNFVSSNFHHNTTSDSRLKTSSLLQRKMYGRVDEKNSIIKMITEAKSDGVTVIPIVGIGGIGKTALAQFVYNDPDVKSLFEDKMIWVWLSNNFDEEQLTREMLDVVCQKKQEGSCNFSKLQEILKSHMKPTRYLLVLDDVWDDMNNYRLNKLLAPFNSNNAEGNVIIMTTRIWSVAKRIGTVKPIELGALEKEDSWMLFKQCAFGDENHELCGSLSIMGQKIEDKLDGNPLEAENIGELLREHHTVEHWNNILKNEDWKSMQLSGGIMPSLKRSYDMLPYQLKQCFLYCSLFPKGYSFSKEQLIQIWIAQGFVEKSSERLEQKGRKYLAELVDSGFYQHVERTSEHFVMHDLMHDLAKLVSQSEFATIDGSECEELPSTIRHVSILTDSAYNKYEDGDFSRNEEFERRLLKVRSRSKLKTLVFIGEYDSHFLKSFQDAFKEAKHLRLLQITSMYADFDYFISSLVYCTHLRYLGLENETQRTLPQALSKCYHLQVLHIGSCGTPNIPEEINNLVSLQHLVAQKGVWSSIANIGEMTSLQELTNFKVENSIGFEITQLQRMSELVELGVSRLENVTTKQEASGASLKDKHHLERLHLFWKGVRNGYDSDGNYNEYDSDLSYSDSDMNSENECDGNMIPEPSMHSETEEERLQTTDSNDVPSLDHIPDTASEVLEGLEPHRNLKYLWISWYNGAKAPTWLATSLTHLQTLRLENCGEWQRLSLERLSLLRKLVLIKMKNASVLSIRSPEEIILIGMQKLHTIEQCPVLKVFPLFQNSQQFKIERMSWLSSLTKLTINDCPHLHVHNPLPPSTIVSELFIAGVSTLPRVEGSSHGTLRIGRHPNDIFSFDSDDILELMILDDKSLSFHSLRSLTRLVIDGCKNLMSVLFESLRQLLRLKSLGIYNCPQLFSSNVPSELTSEDTTGANRNALPSLECLDIASCGINGKWLSLMLQHAEVLQKLSITSCWQIRGLSIGEEENGHPNLMSATEASSSGYPSRDELLHLPLNLIPSLKKVTIRFCSLRFYGNKEGFARFTFLEGIAISRCPELISSLVHNNRKDEQVNGRWLLPPSIVELEIQDDNYLQMLQPCFPGSLTHLKRLQVQGNPNLTSLQLHSCTELQELIIQSCRSLNSLQGLQSLCNLRLLRAYRCLGDLGGDERCLLPQSIEELDIDEYFQETLQPFFPRNLTCLKKLRVSGTTSFKSLELMSCTALEHLKIEGCASLATLVGLQSLHSLRHLEVFRCPSLPLCLESLSGQGYELCPRLERLQIDDLSILTTSLCQHLISVQFLELYGDPYLYIRGVEVARLTDEQERALQLLTSLQELQFKSHDSLVDLPTGLHNLPSLKRLKIDNCKSIMRLPEKGLPPSLEELHISNCSKELADHCRMLESKLMVSTD
uniref:OSJNBb0085C12.7 protein n=3 Tax=Oryza sativa TaxID=4530 RepID=Q7XTR2_ORYSJ|nr:OSJNBb0085C12.7 [Oryza sativa Japonica Group]